MCGRVGEKALALFFAFFGRDPIFYVVLLVVRFPDDPLGKTFMSVGEPDHGGGGVGPLADKCCQVNGKQQQSEWIVNMDPEDGENLVVVTEGGNQ